MADITEYLKQILGAIRGEDVRQAIHDAIQTCYTDGNWDAETGMVDLLARQQIDILNSHSGANTNETQLWPAAGVAEGEGYYDFQLLPLSDVVTNYDYIYVYYKTVLTGTPEIHVFRATDFNMKPSIIEGFYFDTATKEFMARKINIVRAAMNNHWSEDSEYADPKLYGLYNCGMWSWNGSKNSDASVTKVTDSSIGASRPAGTIVRITGIKYNDPGYADLAARVTALESK